MERPPETNPGEVTLRTRLAPLKPKKKALAIWAGIGAAIGLIYTLAVPAQWKANATILMVLSSEDTGGSSAAAASAVSGLSPTAPDPLQVIEGILLSRQSIDLILKRTHGQYDRLQVEKGLKTERKQKAAQLTWSWEDSDPKTAKMVVQTGLDALLMMNHELEFTTAGLQAEFLKKSVQDNELKLTDSEQNLAEFEKHMKAPINPTDPTSAGQYLKERKELQITLLGIDASLTSLRKQAKLTAELPELPTILPTVKPIRDKLIELQSSLQEALTQFGPDAPTVIKIRRDIDVARSELSKEISRYLVTVDKNLDPAISTLEAQKLTTIVSLNAVNELADKAPEEAVELARLAREVAIRGQIYTDLRTKYEEANVAAQVDRVKWSVLESPYIDDKPTNKHYFRTPVMFGVLALMLGGWYNLNKIKKQQAKEAAALDASAAE